MFHVSMCLSRFATTRTLIEILLLYSEKFSGATFSFSTHAEPATPATPVPFIVSTRYVAYMLCWRHGAVHHQTRPSPMLAQ